MVHLEQEALGTLTHQQSPALRCSLGLYDLSSTTGWVDGLAQAAPMLPTLPVSEEIESDRRHYRQMLNLFARIPAGRSVRGIQLRDYTIGQSLLCQWTGYTRASLSAPNNLVTTGYRAAAPFFPVNLTEETLFALVN